MDIKNSITLLFPLILASLVMFFIFSTGMVVYLKVFIQKGLGTKEFIISKTTGGILSMRTKSFGIFNIFYDFTMLSIFSILTYFPIVLMFDYEPYQVVGLYLFLIFMLTLIVRIDELKEITKPRWIIRPMGLIMVWQDGSRLGYVYNFIYKIFGYIMLALFIFFLTAFILYGK